MISKVQNLTEAMAEYPKNSRCPALLETQAKILQCQSVDQIYCLKLENIKR